MKRIYLDHAASTPVCREARAAYRAAETEGGNPGSLHAEGVRAKAILERSRASIAHELAVKSRQVIFTSGSTEGNNLCLVGMARRLQRSRGDLLGTHWIVSAMEHPSVLESFAEIERLGGKVTHIDPNPTGLFVPETVASSIRPETVLVSIGWGNHEVGAVQPLRSLGRVIQSRAHELGIAVPLIHSDLGQAPLYLAPHVHTLGVDMAVIGSGKLYGPRGIGAVYLSNRVELSATSFGGGQERELRAGTESPALAAGFAAALAKMGRSREAEAARLSPLRDELAIRLQAAIPDVIVNTPRTHALPHILNVSIPGIQGEYVVLALDRSGFAISTKSACNAGDVSSHVVAALGGHEERARTTLRFSLGIGTTQRDIAAVSRELPRIIGHAGFSTG